MTESALKYKQNPELRREIAALAGVDHDGRYGGGQAGFRKRHLHQICCHIGDPPACEEVALTDLYQWVCEEVGVEHNGTAGNDWRLQRPALKALVQSLQAGGEQP